jgi:thioesterase domain-containing protein
VHLVAEELGIEGLADMLRTEGDFSVVKITPAHLEILARQLSPQQTGGRTRAFIIGGENLTYDTLRHWQIHAPDTVLVNEYGPTETVVGCCIHRVSANDLGSGSVPIGRPIANTQLYILDKFLQPLPIGVVGELCIGGDGVARGYLNQPEMTAQKFVPDPFSSEPERRLYRTGDLARYRPDGTIEFLGRIDHQVKIRGYRVELGEIEQSLKLHSQVREALVVTREIRPGDHQMVAYVVSDAESAPGAAELRDMLAARLPAHMVPSFFVVLREFPLTPNGKVDRQALPAPEEGAANEDTYVSPRTPLEEALVGMWSQALAAKKVGIHDNFFHLGGDSLDAVGLIEGINHAFDVKLRVLQLYQNPTVAQMAGTLKIKPAMRGDPRIVCFKDGGKKAPVFFMFAGPDEYQIARMVGVDRAIYGIEVPWPMAWRRAAEGQVVEALPTLSEFVAPFTAALGSQTPEPCVLIGFSFAGLIAFEAAHQLRRMGREIEMVVILDSFWKGKNHVTPDWIRILLRRPWQVARHAAGRVAQRVGLRAEGAPGDGKRVILPSRMSPRLDERGVVVPGHDVLWMYDQMRERHAPQPLDVPGVLCQAQNSHHGGTSASAWRAGWRALFAGGMRTVLVPGDHMTMIRDPHHLGVLGQHLHEILA